MIKGGNRLPPLEAIRGLAALVVVMHHTMLGFMPRLHGMQFNEQPWSLFGTPLFAFVNGSAAVVLFFVLSGFVLTNGILTQGSLKAIWPALLKRWPRLAVPVVLSNTLAGGLMAAGLAASQQVAPLTKSVWLGWHYPWQSSGWSELSAAAYEGLVDVFLKPIAVYNTALWTMHYELVGSGLAFAAAAFLLKAGRWSWIVIPAAITSWCILTLTTDYLAPFVVGSFLAALHRAGWPRISPRLAIALIPAILFLLGYHESMATGRPEGFYGFLTSAAAYGPVQLRVVIHTIAAVLIIGLSLNWKPLTSRLSGPVGKRLGSFSFPVYLVHMTVLCGPGCWTYLLLDGYPHAVRSVAAIMVTFVISLLAAVPFVWQERWWLRQLHRFSASGAAFPVRSSCVKRHLTTFFVRAKSHALRKAS